MQNRLAALAVVMLPAIAAAQFKLTIEWGGGSKPAPASAEDVLDRSPSAEVKARRPVEDLDPSPAAARSRPARPIGPDTVGIEEWSEPAPRPRPPRALASAAPAEDLDRPARSSSRAELAGGVVMVPSSAPRSTSPRSAPVGGPAGRTFRQPDTAAAAGLPAYHAGHDCPRCGYTSPAGVGTWVVRGVNADGTHTHQCPNCGATWRHRRE